jgi:glycosyltransferase involved in cell wall biosynthesis
MKVLHIITTIEIGGAEKQLVTTIRHLSKLGVESDVIYLKGEDKLRNELYQNGVNTVLSLFETLKTICYFFRVEDKPEIIHAHLPRAELLGVLLSRLLNVPLVVSKHNCEPNFPKMPSYIQELICRLIEKQTSYFIAISKQVEQYLASEKMVKNRNKVKQIYYSADERLHSIHKMGEVAFEKSKLKGIVVSRLVPQKNLSNLLQSVHLSRELFQSVSIYGEGSSKREILQVIEQLNLEGIVKLEGKRFDLHEYLQQFDIMLFVPLYEGFGLALLEAMQAGLPVVASRIPVFEEILGHSYPFLVDAHSPADISEGVARIAGISKPEFSKIYESRLKHFEGKVNIARILDVYRKTQQARYHAK